MPETLISSSAVSGAYRSSSEIRHTPGPIDIAPAEDRPSFADMVAQQGAETVRTIREAEAMAEQGLAGKADTQAVVEATLQLESTVKIAVTVRDKLVEAYQEIMRMPI